MGKSKMKKTMGKMGKMAKKHHKKQQKKNALAKAAHELPQPPVPLPPPMSVEHAATPEPETTQGTWRVVHEACGFHEKYLNNPHN